MSKYAYGIAVAALAAALASPANAQLLARKDLSLAMALTIATTAIATCKTNDYAVSASVVGRNGEVLVQLRGDNTGPHTIENSFRKAYTARTFRIPSGDMVKRVKDDPTLGLIHLAMSLPIRARCRSRSVTRPSVQPAHQVHRAERKTRLASRLASIKSPTSSSEPCVGGTAPCYMSRGVVQHLIHRHIFVPIEPSPHPPHTQNP
jgi:Haem-degrading